MARNRFLDGLGGFFGDVGRARNASNLYSQLSGLSDDALRARGLSRESLAAYAFNSSFGEK